MFPTSGGCDTKVTFFVIALNVNKLLSCDVLRIYAPLQVSCHLTRSVNIHRTVCHNPFYNKLFHDCAPYATYFVRPTEAYKTTLFIIYLEIFFICCLNDYLNVCTYLTGVDKVLLKLAKEHFLYSFLYLITLTFLCNDFGLFYSFIETIKMILV